MRQVEPYRGRHAELYDCLYAEKPYDKESAVVSRLLTEDAVEGGRNLLELACGTGRHAQHLASLGHEVTGIDYSQDMVRVAQERTHNVSGVHVQHGDMRELPFASDSFDAVICLFDSIGYLLDNDSISQAIGETFRVLKDGGVFLFEFWHAPAMLRSFEPVRLRTFPMNRGFVRRLSETTIDPVLQQASVRFKIEEVDQTGALINQLEETQTNRFFMCQEVDLFLRRAGCGTTRFFPAYQIDRPIDLETWHVLAMSRKC